MELSGTAIYFIKCFISGALISAIAEDFDVITIITVAMLAILLYIPNGTM